MVVVIDVFPAIVGKVVKVIVKFAVGAADIYNIELVLLQAPDQALDVNVILEKLSTAW